jgi:DUF438 domain-containing protein
MVEKRNQLKKLLERLHKGESLEHIKAEFSELAKEVSPADISAVEEEMVKSGMPQQEIHRLCDIHMAVLKEKFDSTAPIAPAGHPIHILMEEHKVILGLANELRDIARKLGENAVSVNDVRAHLIDILHHFIDSEKHYVREENVLFPYLEKHGITQPPAIMWMEHDQIRELKKSFQRLWDKVDKLSEKDFSGQLDKLSLSLVELLSNHFYKENNILFPTSLQVIPENEWAEIKHQFDDLGYCCFTPQNSIVSSQIVQEAGIKQKKEGLMDFETGSLTPAEVEDLLNSLPVDITFVGKDDTVRYFSQTKDRIFPRAKAIIGRTVQNCHPEKSVHKVNQIVADFKSKKRDTAEFWINLGGKMIYIKYFAIRDNKGEYIGTMEVTQDITHIKKLEGEKRLMD